MKTSALSPVVRFADLRPGSLFRWQSNLGGQDTMRKVGEHDLLNLRTGNQYRVDAVTHYFGKTDRVVVLG